MDSAKTYKKLYNPLRYYKGFKRQYLEFIIFVKFGQTYITYESDAYIIEYLLKLEKNDSYVIKKENFKNIVKLLHENNLNVVLVGKKYAKEFYSEKESQYIKIRSKCKHYFKNS